MLPVTEVKTRRLLNDLNASNYAGTNYAWPPKRISDLCRVCSRICHAVIKACAKTLNHRVHANYVTSKHSKGSISPRLWLLDKLLNVKHHKLLMALIRKVTSKETPRHKYQYLASMDKLLSTLHWRHNGRDSVSNHQPYDCLLNHLFRSRSKENITAPRHWPLCGEYRWIPRTNGQ